MRFMPALALVTLAACAAEPTDESQGSGSAIVGGDNAESPSDGPEDIKGKKAEFAIVRAGIPLAGGLQSVSTIQDSEKAGYELLVRSPGFEVPITVIGATVSLDALDDLGAAGLTYALPNVDSSNQAGRDDPIRAHCVQG